MRDRHINTFTGVINQDVDPLLLPPGEYIDALNIIHGTSGVQGALENPLGTSSVSFSKLNSGTKNVISAVEDKQNQRVYYFIQNTTNAGLNQIARWDAKAGTILEVAEGSAISGVSSLGMRVDNRVQGAIIDGKYLYFTDGRVIDGVLEGYEPKKINVQKGVRDDRNLNAVLYADIFDETCFANGNTYLIRVRNTAGTQVEVTTFTADGTYENDPAGGLLWLKTQIEADALDAYMNVELCGECKLLIEMVDLGYTVEMTTSDEDAILVPEDWYPLTLETYHVSLVKQPAVWRRYTDKILAFRNTFDRERTSSTSVSRVITDTVVACACQVNHKAAESVVPEVRVNLHVIPVVPHRNRASDVNQAVIARVVNGGYGNLWAIYALITFIQITEQ